jgi:uncharacterized protein (DUF1778 family)
MKNSSKGRRKPTTSLKAIRVYASREQFTTIHEAAQTESLSDSKFLLRSGLKDAARVLRGNGNGK